MLGKVGQGTATACQEGGPGFQQVTTSPPPGNIESSDLPTFVWEKVSMGKAGQANEVAAQGLVLTILENNP